MARACRLPLDMISLDRRSPVPLHRQLYDTLRAHILDGKVPSGARLPATRELANDLGVSRNTVIAAYDALLAEGYLDSVAGSGTRVAPLPPRSVRASTGGEDHLPPLSARGQLMAAQPRDRTTAGLHAFRPGLPEIDTFPFSTWARLVAAHTRHAHEDLFGYHLIAGHPRLRRALSEYLAVSRGVRSTPEQVIVLPGAQAALDLIARMFMDPGDYFWTEDPGYLGAHTAFLAAGGKPVPLPVGPDGWHLEGIARPSPRLIFVTPSCQWPRALVMPMEARLRLLQIAEAHDAWIIEDDYDSEYRFRGRPIPAMQGIDQSGRVIYLGTLSKTMFPSMRIAYLVIPERLASAFKTALSITGQYPPLLPQVALADFISEGFFATHLRRMRRLYARRQREFLALCESRLGRWISVQPSDTGMQVSARFKQPMDDGVVLAAARRHGVDFVRMSTQYRHSTPEHGMLLGYAGVGQDEMRSGVESLRAAFVELDQAAPLRTAAAQGGAR